MELPDPPLPTTQDLEAFAKGSNAAVEIQESIFQKYRELFIAAFLVAGFLVAIVIMITAAVIADRSNMGSGTEESLDRDEEDKDREITRDDPDGIEVQIYPIEAERNSCTDNEGKVWPTTGTGAARWFIWGGCSRWKIFSVDPVRPVRLSLNADMYSCQDADFSIYEQYGGQWVIKKSYDYDLGPGGKLDVVYNPQTSKIKVESRSCFYLDIYEQH